MPIYAQIFPMVEKQNGGVRYLLFDIYVLYGISS